MLTAAGSSREDNPPMKVETEEGNVVLTARQREVAPYVVLVDPLGARGAAYNNRHKLIVDDVSPALLAFANPAGNVYWKRQGALGSLES